MENNKGAAPEATAVQENKEAAPAPAASCFKRTTVSEDASFAEAAKEQYRQFKEAPMEEHWSCIKNKFLSVFGDFGGAKDKAQPSIESQ